jgi:hypothetical protein
LQETISEAWREKNIELKVVGRVQAALHSSPTVERYRVSPTDWTRRRKLPFERVAALILRGHKLSGQTALNKVFRALDEVDVVPTPSA